MKADVLLGLQWGDEGKGKIVDVLTPRYDIVARFQGGPNAGHTIEFENQRFILHTIPSGIFNPDTINVVGNGVIIDPYIFKREIDVLLNKQVRIEDNLQISKKAHLILPSHRLLDAAYEEAKGKSKIGSTLKGIGPTYTDKTARNGLRIGNIGRSDFLDMYRQLKEKHIQILDSFNFDYKSAQIEGCSLEEYEEKWFDALKTVKQIRHIDSEYFINKSLNDGKSLLAEGAQGTMLDVDFGTYPFVTSSNTVTAGVCTGLGIPPSRVGEVFGIFKAYCTRVGGGPFPSELTDANGQILRDEGNEYGSTTGRPRRCGWLDLTALNYAIMLNGVTQLLMTKADVLNKFETIKAGVSYRWKNHEINHVPFDASYEDLKPVYEELPGWKSEIQDVRDADQMPPQLKEYIAFIQQQTGVPVKMVSVGPDRKQIIQI
jgi:adenylosuccinate synthase